MLPEQNNKTWIIILPRRFLSRSLAVVIIAHQSVLASIGRRICTHKTICEGWIKKGKPGRVETTIRQTYCYDLFKRKTKSKKETEELWNLKTVFGNKHNRYCHKNSLDFLVMLFFFCFFEAAPSSSSCSMCFQGFTNFANFFKHQRSSLKLNFAKLSSMLGCLICDVIIY